MQKHLKHKHNSKQPSPLKTFIDRIIDTNHFRKTVIKSVAPFVKTYISIVYIIQIQNTIIFFQVISAPGVSAWLEPVPQLYWLKEMKTVFIEHDANVKCCFVHPGCVSINADVKIQNIYAKFTIDIFYNKFFSLNLNQIWYEVIHDIVAGDELLLAPKVPLNFRDMFYDNSDKETGKQIIWIYRYLFLIQRVILFCL